MKILLVDDDQFIRRELQKALVQEGGLAVETASNGMEALAKMEEDTFDLVLTDIKMPKMDGFELLQKIKGSQPEVIVIMMTAFGSIETAVDAIKIGADDYITKPVNFKDLLIHISKAEKASLLLRENQLLRTEVRKKFEFHNIIGKSPKMQEVFSLIEKVSPSNSTVIVYGGSGTGKELVAKAIHYNSPRGENPFIPFNSGAIPETLVESELFGHTKGAYTGAVQARKGMFEEADGGTIFLDEIAMIHPSAQVKLLRVLQEKEIVRVGSNDRVKVDVRVIAATNEDLESKMKRGEFREDLFYRLHVFPIFLPDLKDRSEDIPLLLHSYLDRYSRENRKNIQAFSKEALKALMEYPWPGNVRELENVIERAVILAEGERINIEDLPLSLQQKMPAGKKFYGAQRSLKEVEEEYIKEVIAVAGGNRQKAAAILKISPKTLYRFQQKNSN